MPILIDERLTIPDAELDVRFTPSSGPGGQHANKASTRVELTWNIAESTVLTEWQQHRLASRLGQLVTVSADDERSQVRNRAIAERRLAQRVRESLVVQKSRRPTRPSRGSVERRLQSKRSTSQNKKLRRRPSRDD